MKEKILYVHHSGNKGGAPISLSYIIKGLDRSTFEPVLVNIAEGPINKFFKGLNTKFLILKGAQPFHGSTVVEKNNRLFLRNWIFLIPTIWKAYFTIKKEKPDLIHLNSTCLFSFAIAASLLKKKIPVVCHVREPLRDGIWGWPLRFFCKLYVDGFIAICQNDLDSLRLKEKTSIKATVIYNFYSKPEPEHKPKQTQINQLNFREEMGISENAIIFLYLARFADSNGWKDLINYAKAFTAIDKDCHFVLAGAQKEYPEYNELNNVHILSFRDDVPAILSTTDIFVCPFVEPHFARGVIEASAYGIPVIGKNIGGVNELIVHGLTGYLYTTEEEFLKYAKRLAENKTLRKELGKEGIHFSEENFNMQINLARTYAFYNNFLFVRNGP